MGPLPSPKDMTADENLWAWLPSPTIGYLEKRLSGTRLSEARLFLDLFAPAWMRLLRKQHFRSCPVACYWLVTPELAMLIASLYDLEEERALVGAYFPTSTRVISFLISYSLLYSPCPLKESCLVSNGAT